MIIRLAALAALAVLAACTTAEPQPNLGQYRAELVQWHTDGRYAASFDRAVARADRLIAASARRPAGGKRALVLDIDETALSNWRYLTAVGFAVDAESFSRWTKRNNDPAFPSTLALFQRAKSAGFSVFFVTGRPEPLRAVTERQLRAAGYSGWDGLFLKPRDYANPSVIPYKSGVRRHLAEKGYDIVLSLGDQWSDLRGGYARKTVKLPNPYYYIP
jgi:acid phosphatase